MPAAASSLASLRALARRHARRSEEADDLLQSALLAAVEAGRADLSAPDNQRWLAGVIRNRATMDARTSARRRRRETGWAEHVLPHAERGGGESPRSGETEGANALSTLVPSLRVTALLAFNGCTRAEIAWLLNLTDTALRQRLTQLRRALKSLDAPGMALLSAVPVGPLSYGLIRRALLAPTRRREAFLASHDPDGHLFMVSRSQISDPRQH